MRRAENVGMVTIPSRADGGTPATGTRVLIPQLEAVPRFAPDFVSDDDLEDLSTFFTWPKEVCMERLRSFSQQELADRWKAKEPQTSEQVLSFYRDVDLYIWDLMQWHSSLGRRPHWEKLANLTEHFAPRTGFRRVLDFGCGIGTDGVFLARSGYDVTLVDVESPQLRFAKHRFARRGLLGTFIESRSDLPELDGTYDIVVCFDVLEHLPEPLEAASRLVRALRPGGLFVVTTMFDDNGGTYPCHLATNTIRFGGVRWHIHLAGLGLRHTDHFYRKISGFPKSLQRLRFLVWRASGLWVTWVKPK